MKHLLATLCLIGAGAAAAGLLAYRLGGDPALHDAAKNRDAMEWLRADFHLSDRQLAEIQRLHDGYTGSCEEHCRRIQEAMRLQRSLLAAHADPKAIGECTRRLQELRSICEAAMARHVRQVAAVMSPKDGRRYLDLVLPKIADFDHRAAPDLHLNHPI